MTVGGALADCRAALTGAGIESAALDARLLMATALESRVELVIARPERELPDEAATRLQALLRRRIAREPLAQILGRREFWSLDFAVNADVLTPRPDSETLVAAVLERVPDRKRALSILDLGTGSGCLLLSLMSNLPNAHGLGVDCGEAALAVARRNARTLGLDGRASFVQGCWTDGISDRFDIVISNPPYIATGDLETLAPELRYEPVLALDGGADGLAAYRAFIPGVGAVLAKDGLIALEIGQGQDEEVDALLRKAGFGPSARYRDLGGINRCLTARRD
jgi:release factor glutamine methyltransferase